MITETAEGLASNVIQLHSLEDQAVFALTEIVDLYLCRTLFKHQDMFRAADNDDHEISRSWSLSQLFEVERRTLGISPHAMHILESPIRGSLRNAMIVVGEALYKHTGSTAIMSTVLQRVAENFEDEQSQAHAISALDHAFHGIGGWLA